MNGSESAPRVRRVDISADDILSGLTPEQREAAVHRDGPLLIIAGAGSGKTRTVTRRIAHLIGQGVYPS